MNKVYTGALLTLISALGFGFLPIFTNYAYRTDITLTTVLFIRFFLASCILFLISFMKYKRFSVGRRELLGLAFLGLVCYNVQSRAYLTSVKYIPSSLAVLLLYTHPMIVAFLTGFVDKIKLSRATWISLIICSAGLLLVLSAAAERIDPRGIFLALLASVAYSLYILVGDRVVQSTPPLVATSFITFFASLGFVITGLFTKSLSFKFSPQAWPPVLGITIFGTLIAVLFFFQGMEALGGTKAAIISMSEPFFTILLSAMLLSESMTPLQIVGGLVLLGGAVIVVLDKDKGTLVDEGAHLRGD